MLEFVFLLYCIFISDKFPNFHLSVFALDNFTS
jgi:hypothetical protein